MKASQFSDAQKAFILKGNPPGSYRFFNPHYAEMQVRPYVLLRIVSTR